MEECVWFSAGQCDGLQRDASCASAALLADVSCKLASQTSKCSCHFTQSSSGISRIVCKCLLDCFFAQELIGPVKTELKQRAWFIVHRWSKPAVRLFILLLLHYYYHGMCSGLLRSQIRAAALLCMSRSNKTLPQSVFKGFFLAWLPLLDLQPKRLPQLWEDANSAGLVTKFFILQPNKLGLYKRI